MNNGAFNVANIATGGAGQQTKLPTSGVWTNGTYVAQAGSRAFKVKASAIMGSTGVALQAVDNNNNANVALNTAEIDLILTRKLGEFDFKAILMDRSFDNDANDAAMGGQSVRVIASVNF